MMYLIQPERAKASSAARGAERWLNIHIHSSLEECVSVLREEGYKLWVADIEEGRTPHSISVDRPIAVLMGTELTGVSKEAGACRWLYLCSDAWIHPIFECFCCCGLHYAYIVLSNLTNITKTVE